jgi:hypothetical protein
MFHFAVVLEKRDVIGGGLNAQYPAEFVVNLDTGRSHAVLDAAPLNAGAQA